MLSRMGATAGFDRICAAVAPRSSSSSLPEPSVGASSAVASADALTCSSRISTASASHSSLWRLNSSSATLSSARRSSSLFAASSFTALALFSRPVAA